jgi:hypothetical protein
LNFFNIDIVIELSLVALMRSTLGGMSVRSVKSLHGPRGRRAVTPGVTVNTRSYVTPGVTVNTRPYVLKRRRALLKKLSACDQNPIDIVEKKGGNYRIYLNAAAFEEVRDAIVNLLHLGKQTGRGSRHVSVVHIRDEDDNIETETYTINNWAAIVKPKSTPKTVPKLGGDCCIVLNLYRTKSSFLINGKDAPTFMKLATRCCMILCLKCSPNSW